MCIIVKILFYRNLFMYQYLLTSSLWLESFVKKEVQKQGYDIVEVQDKAVYFKWDIDAVARMNLWSRFGNLLYLIVGQKKEILDFDDYFDAVFDIDWDKLIPHDFQVNIKATSIKSELGATPTLQALAKKAIVKNLVWDDTLRESPERWTIDIRILMDNNNLKVLLNTSGNGLHKRGYREMTWEAPIKENIAAALVIISQWRFKQPLWDMFCGSGTIAIEAAMIAMNKAPGMTRKFAFESWDWLPEKLLETEKTSAKSKEFSWEYTIYASDINKHVLESAKRNAKFAGVDAAIRFQLMDYKDIINKGIKGYLVSNPPYGERLEDFDVIWIHKDIARLFAENDNLQGGIITSHEAFEWYQKVKYKKRKLYNGGELCYFYRKM